jgi:4'-phosphopantetheinyl transferase
VPLVLTAAAHEACCGVISGAERVRADRYRSGADARRFIAAHGYLRFILGGYAGLPPADIGFSTSSYGKPSLEVPAGRVPLSFNMSDSGGIALIAVARGRDIGVDVELVNAAIDVPGLSRKCFCAAESGLLGETPQELKAEMFYTLWTRKEAYIKSRGEGLSLDLTAIDVSAAPVTLEGRWALEDIRTDAGYKGAIAVDGGLRHIRYYTIRS